MNEFLDALEDDVFEERPVDLTTFITSSDYMNHPPLSDKQYRYVELGSQIYKPETLYEVYDRETADRLAEQNVNELVLLWGKGAGKNNSTVLMMARMIYLLLCLKDPSRYYGKPSDNNIDLLNIAVNAQQAQNTFFNPFKTMIKNSPWFRNKFDDGRNGIIRFDKNITCYSAHSEREAWEGYNVICAVLDEIAAFKTESELSNSNKNRANTASAIYEMYRGSVDSRFPDVGKVVMISFSRFKGDFIQEHYDHVVADKVVQEKSHTFKVNKSLPDGDESNEFDIHWNEDKVVAYNFPRVFAEKAPSWEVNPTRTIDDYTSAFLRNPIDALTRFAANPPDAVDAFFRDREKVETAFSDARFPFDEEGRFNESFVGEPDTEYYMHVDLAHKSDRAALAVCHIEDWVTTYKGTPMETIAPKVKLDAIKWWTPTHEKNVEFHEIREYILAFRNRGFNLKYVTFDRWAGSITLQEELVNVGIHVETLSVGREQYNNLSQLIYEHRMNGYQVPMLVDELLQLRLLDNGKVDHIRGAHNDLSDAVAGAAYQAIKHTPYGGEQTIEVEYLDDIVSNRERADAELRRKQAEQQNMIHKPREIPEELQSWLDGLQSI